MSASGQFFMSADISATEASVGVASMQRKSLKDWQRAPVRTVQYSALPYKQKLCSTNRLPKGVDR
jgi:hypothetical protein